MRGPLIAILTLTLIAAGAVCFHWHELESERLRVAAEREVAATVERNRDEARALLGKTRAALIDAIDDHLLPTADEIAAAADAYGRAAALDPDSVEAASGASLVEGLALVAKGRLDEAMEEFTVAMDGEPQLGGYLHGWLQFSRHKPLEAWGEFGQLLAQYDGWAPAKFYRLACDADLSSDRDRYDELHKAVVRWPAHPDVIAAMGRELGRKHGDPDAGMEWYLRAVELGSIDPFVVERVALRWLDANQAEKARDLLLKRVAREPRGEVFRLLLARAHEVLEEYEQAEAQLTAAIVDAPADRILRLTMAIHYLNLGDGPRAAEVLEVAHALQAPDGVNIAFIGGEMLLKDLDAARRLLGANCAQGFQSSCVEACYLGARENCGSVPGYHDPSRRSSSVSVLGRDSPFRYPRYTGSDDYRPEDQVVTADGRPVTDRYRRSEDYGGGTVRKARRTR